MSKTIYINGRFLLQQLSGVQRFAFEMSKKLSKKDNVNIILLTPAFSSIKKSYNYDFNIKRIGFNRSHLWEQVDLLLFLKSNNNPLLINFSNSCPILYSNQISTIHDLSIYANKNWFSFFYYQLYKYIFPRMIKKSHKILTVSNFTKHEIMKKFNLIQENIIVTNNARDLCI